MHKFSFFTVSFLSRLLLSAVGLSSLACRNEGADSGTESVTALTPVRDQGRIGFCWAYAITAMVESEYKARTGRTIILSPEAIGMQRLVQSFADIFEYANSELKSGKSPNEIENFIGNAFKTFDAKSGEFILSNSSRNIDQSNNLKDSLKLVETYGFIPESVWHEKFPDIDTLYTKVVSMQRGFFELLREKKGQMPTSLEILTKVIGLGLTSVPPYGGFEFEGKQYTSQSFMRDVINYSGNNYTIIKAKNPDDSKKLLNIIRESIDHGHPAVLGFSISRALLKGNHFISPSGPFVHNGIHFVLATEFVTNLGKPAVKFKNSWGFSDGTDEGGIKVNSNDGFYTADEDYLIAGSKYHLSAIISKVYKK